MSPLLFFLIMEYLTRVLHWFAHHSNMKFHPGCKTIRLNALYFADDLILLCKANENAVKAIFEGLFSMSSGLSINHHK